MKNGLKIVGFIVPVLMIIAYPYTTIYVLQRFLPPSLKVRWVDLAGILIIGLLFSGGMFLLCKKTGVPNWYMKLTQIILWLLIIILINLIFMFQVAHA